MTTTPPPTEHEGVTRFVAHHTHAGAVEAPEELWRALLGWRAVLFDLGVLGQDPQRYGGAGFGNVSARLDSGPTHFLVSGTQTGGTRQLSRTGFAQVTHHDVPANTVHSVGPVAPSSESLTHGTLYACDPRVRWVLHVHAPNLWGQAARLGLPRTAADVEYGTPQMAQAVERLVTTRALADVNVFTMEGHQDGVVAVGNTADEAGCALVVQLARAG